jgi:hypothetical protein
MTVSNNPDRTPQFCSRRFGRLAVDRVFAVIAFAIVFPTLADAADWKPLGRSAFVDAASIRTDYFSTPGPGGLSFTLEPYRVVWVKVTMDDGDVLAETLFNCRGGFEIIQQIVANETPNSRFHSFDNAVTAWQALFDQAQLKAAQTVVIPGAAGKAMLESLMDNSDCPPVSLYWGSRSTDDLYLHKGNPANRRSLICRTIGAGTAQLGV